MSKFLGRILVLLAYIVEITQGEEVITCGGFVMMPQGSNFDMNSLWIQITSLQTGLVQEKTQPAPNGYYFFPIQEQATQHFSLSVFSVEQKESTLQVEQKFTGVSFHPESIEIKANNIEELKNLCQNDLNFQFEGYTIHGQVVNPENQQGPEGIKLLLYKIGENQAIQSTMTKEGGFYTFNKIVTGDYIIKPSTEFYIKEKQVQLTIYNEGYTLPPLHVTGYNIKGQVLEIAKQHIKDIVISVNISTCLCAGCIQQDNLCNRNPDESGNFLFRNVTPGVYKLQLQNKGNIIFEFSQSDWEFEIKNQDASKVFVAKFFTIPGKVIDAKKQGIPNVQINLDGDHKTTTDSDGSYKLEHLQEGTYTIEAFLDENTIFETLKNVHISASEQIPDISVKFYAICGKIQILSGFTQQRYVSLNEQGGAEQKTVTDQYHKFCFEVKPMKTHTIIPYISTEEKERGLSFTPEKLEIMADRPILDADFQQSKVSIQIDLECIGQCHQVQIDILNLQSNTQLIEIADKNQLLFSDFLPGSYSISIQEKLWCWESIKVDIQVFQKKNIVKFKQTGFKVPYSSTHEFKGILQDNSTIQISKGSEKSLCLKDNKPIKLIAESCYKFENLDEIVLTPGQQINFKANKFLIRGYVVADKRAKLSVVEKTQIEIQETGEIISLSPVVYQNQPAFIFIYYAYNNHELTFIPLSEESEQQNLLFYPQQIKVKVQNDCILDQYVLTARPGLIIEGQVLPGVPEVSIKVNVEGQQIAAAQTDKNGKYKIGPLYDHLEYTVQASKQGYNIQQDNTNLHNFFARKLSHLQVKIGTEKPLANIFVTCFSAEAPTDSKPRRYSGSTNEQGMIEFLDLPQGNYYIKPTLKEYEFTPSQKFIELPEGQTLIADFIWQQVAFSVFGKVVKFNKDPIEGIQVLAVNLTDSFTDQLGNFRIKGLQPNTQYVIMPRSDRILHTSPPNITFVMRNQNIEDIEFLVLPKLSTYTLTGKILVEIQEQLYVQIWNSQKNLVQEKRLSKTGFFQFSELKQDDYTIVVRSLENLFQRAVGRDERYLEIKIDKAQQIIMGKIKQQAYNAALNYMVWCFFLQSLWQYSTWKLSENILINTDKNLNYITLLLSITSF